MFEQHVYAIVLQMTSAGNLRLRPNIGQSVHAAFLSIIHTLDPALAERLHSENQQKLYTTSPLWAQRSTVAQGDTVFVRFAFLDPSLAALFVEQFLLHGLRLTLQIEGVSLAITNIYATNESHPRAGKLPITFMAAVPSFRQVKVNFLTPTAFSRKNGQHEDYLPDMSPELVWKYARRAWGYSGGNDPGQGYDEWVRRYCFIENSFLTPHQLKFDKFTFEGVQGQATYALRGDTPNDENRALWCYLTRFMAFSSIGYKTTMGMGQVEPEILP